MSVVRRSAVVMAAAAMVVGTGLSADASTMGRRTAQTATCTGVLSGSVRDVVVPNGATCWIRNAAVSGGVQVSEGASLAINNADVRGTITLSGNGAFLAVKESRTENIRNAGAYGNVFLEKANVGAVTTASMFELAAREVTFRRTLNTGHSSVMLDDVAVKGRLIRADGMMGAGRFVMRLGKISGDAQLQGARIAVCGSKFSDDVEISGNTPIFGTNGRRCGGNVVRGDLSYDSTFYFKYAQRAGVSGNTVHGRAVGTSQNPDQYPVTGSKNRFKRGAKGILKNLPHGVTPDIAPLDLSQQVSRAQAVRDAAS